jgi:HlyD family secretion protein
MKKFLKYLILAVIAVVFIGTLGFLYSKSQQKPVVYQLDTPAKMTIVKKTVATGKVIPRREIEVKSQVSGVVEKLYVVAGQEVKKGQTIARISLRPNMISVSQAEAQVQSAKTSLKNQALDLQRYKGLLQQKLISDLEFNKHQTDYQLQEEAVAAAENTLLLLKTGKSRNASNVSNMIPATIDGTVLDVPNKEGAFILETSTFQAGTTLATLADMTDMIFEGLVDESEVGKLKQGMELVLNVQGDARVHRAEGRDGPGHDQVHDPRGRHARQGAVPALELLGQRRHRPRPPRERARDQRGRPHHRGQEDVRRSRDDPAELREARDPDGPLGRHQHRGQVGPCRG